MKKFIVTMLLGTALSAFGAQAGDRPKILGVFYEGCEKTCQGFTKAMNESGFAHELEILDLKQDKTRIAAAVDKVKAEKPDLVVVYGTTTTVGMLGTLEKADPAKTVSEVPVVFTAVADPIGSKVIKSFEDSGRPNITGTFNRVPEKLNVQIIKRYDPSFTKLGLLYHANEKNSVLKRDELQKLAEEMGFELVALELEPGSTELPKPESIEPRMKDLQAQGVKWLYLGSSSFLNAQGAITTQAAVDHGIGLVSPYPALVKEHKALLSIAAPREEVGALAAEQVLKVLRDKTAPQQIPIAIATRFTYTVNADVAKHLGLEPPAELASQVEFYRSTQ